MKLWKNGVFHTMLTEQEAKYQMATNQGVIVGFDQEIEHLDFDEVIDLKGNHIYPGFVDAHLHLLGYGQKLSRPNLKNLKDKEAVLDILKKSFNHEPLFAEGYFECGVTKDDLNQISSTYPILIRHNDYHSVTANDIVLKKVKALDSNGFLTEDLAEQAMHTFPMHTNQVLENLLKKSIQALYRYGLTGGHSDDLFYYDGFYNTLGVFDKVLSQMPFRAHLIVHHMVLDDYIKSNRVFLNQTPYLQLGAVKMFYDGTVSSKTALMKAQYKDSESYGMRIHSKETFEQMVKKTRLHELNVAIHVIGDQGLVEVLEILKKHPPKPGTYDRLIHTPWVDEKALMMIKNMPLSIDIQPQFLSSDLPWALGYFSQIPRYAFPWKSLLKQGVPLAGSSDAPIEIPNPLLGIHAAVKRQSDHDSKVYFEDEALTRFEAISLYTKGANFSTMDPYRGYLKQGYIADLTIFTEDLLLAPIEDFKKDILYATVINETIVYKKS
ncbi:MAG: amidohydrolase [Acholeplasmataceae bacterium]|nr:amidohydrolase [Acholeplasmataceae bacterium]